MSLSESSSDQKATPAVTTSADTVFPEGCNSADQEKKLSDSQGSRFDKLVIRFSSRKFLFQSVCMIPSFVTLLYLGVDHIHDCPIQPLISVFLIVTGCANFINIMLVVTAFITANYIKRSSDSSPYARYLLIGNLIGQLILLIFNIVWLVPGQIWVFGAQKKGLQTTDPTQPATYCRAAVFWNGFVTIIVTYVIFLMLILFFTIRYIKRRRNAKREAASADDKL